MSNVILIFHNKLGKKSTLIGIADHYKAVETIVSSHMHSTYPAHKPRLIAQTGSTYKIGYKHMQGTMPDIHYSTEWYELNTRRV